jgi:hypothetical protein
MQKARLLVAALIVLTPFAASADIIRFHHNGFVSFAAGDDSQFFGHGRDGMRHGWFELDLSEYNQVSSLPYQDLWQRNHSHGWAAMSRFFNGRALQRSQLFDGFSPWASTSSHSSHAHYFWVDSDLMSDLTPDDETSSSVSVPEPGTLGLLGAALAGIGLMRRRRRPV